MRAGYPILAAQDTVGNEHEFVTLGREIAAVARGELEAVVPCDCGLERVRQPEAGPWPRADRAIE